MIEEIDHDWVGIRIPLFLHKQEQIILSYFIGELQSTKKQPIYQINIITPFFAEISLFSIPFTPYPPPAFTDSWITSPYPFFCLYPWDYLWSLRITQCVVVVEGQLILQLGIRMSSLLERRKKQMGQLKISISNITFTRKREACEEEQQTAGLAKEYQTAHDLNGSTEFERHHVNVRTHHSLNEGESRELQFSLRENAFEECFRMQEKVGEGAHGIVRKCVHKQSGKVFAVKVLHMEDEHYRSIKTNFFNIKQLKHENIIKYKALYLNPKQRLCHLVMEYLPYPKLRQGCDENILRMVFYHLLDALTYLHHRKICHRDIKPDNILADTALGLVKIIDFGVSKNMKLRGRYQEMLTNTGTPFYKAPEMFLGGSYTEKIDSWAAGVTLYELIAGRTPFQSEYHSDTIFNITNRQPEFSEEDFSGFSPLAKDLISRLLKKKPSERLSCEQAKKHLWFLPHLEDVDLMKSARFGLKEEADFNWLMERRSSLNEAQYHNMNPSSVSKGEKETMKRWLSIISEDDSATGQECNFELVESEDEDDDSPFLSKAPSSVSLTSKGSVFTI